MKSQASEKRAPKRARRASALATNLRRWRKRRRLSVEELARSAKVSAPLLGAMESGERYEDVRLGTVQALALALDVPLTALLSSGRRARGRRIKPRPSLDA